MRLRKKVALVTALVFVLSLMTGIAIADDGSDRPGFPPGQAKKAEKVVRASVNGDVYRMDGHPSLNGLYRAYANVLANGASERAQEVLAGLIDARGGDPGSVEDAVYEAVYEGEQAWALRKLGLALRGLKDPEAAEALLRLAFELDPDDEETAGALSEQFRLNGNKALKVFIKGMEADFDVPPTLINNRTMVPLRKLAESLDAEVDWEDGTVVFVQGGKVVVLPVDSLEATIDGETVTLDTPALVVNGRVLVPLRFVGESLQAQVKYHPKSGMVTVNGDDADEDGEDDEDDDEDEDEEDEE